MEEINEQATPGTEIMVPATADPVAMFKHGTKILKRINNINQFEFRVDYQKTSALHDRTRRQKLVSVGYGILNAVLKETNMHFRHSLEGSEDDSDDTVRFVFRHDRNHFQVRIASDGLSIDRTSSSWANFYNWYETLMPMASRIEGSFRKEIQDSSDCTITPVQSHYTFTFILADFRRGADDAAQRNLAVLAEILPVLPDQKGNKQKILDQSFHRVNLHVSKREVFAGKVRNAWYIIEAPFNEAGRVLHCRFELRGTSFEERDGEKIKSISRFDEDSLDDYSIALNEFLKLNAIERFLGGLLGDTWKFEAVREI